MTDHDTERGTAELAYWLDPDAWGQGYATEAAGRLVKYGFDQRALRKWSAKIVGGNDRSVAVVDTDCVSALGGVRTYSVGRISVRDGVIRENGARVEDGDGQECQSTYNEKEMIHRLADSLRGSRMVCRWLFRDGVV